MSTPSSRLSAVPMSASRRSSTASSASGRRSSRNAGRDRDRKELVADWNGRQFRLVDTGGWLARWLDALTRRSASRPNVRCTRRTSSCWSSTSPWASWKRMPTSPRSFGGPNKPVIVVANKVDTTADLDQGGRSRLLGLGDPVPVSAIHGRGSGDLLDCSSSGCHRKWKYRQPSDRRREDLPGVAIVGRPNVGKSTLFNRLVGDERVRGARHARQRATRSTRSSRARRGRCASSTRPGCGGSRDRRTAPSTTSGACARGDRHRRRRAARDRRDGRRDASGSTTGGTHRRRRIPSSWC